MGKVFVKGPVESPDDLLAKESRLGQAGRLIGGTALDATQGAINLTRPGAIQSAADLAGIPINILRYLANKDWKRKLSPEEEASQRVKLRHAAEEEFRQSQAQQMADREMAENFRRLETMSPSDDRKIEPLPEVTGSRFSRAGRQQRKDSKQALADAMNERKEMYEKLQAAQRLPSQEQAELNRIAAVKEKARRDVEAEDYRRGLRGQKQRGGEAVHGKSQEIIDASNAAEQANVGGGNLTPLPPEIQTTINRNIANQEIEQTATVPETQTQISPADNAASVAASGGVNSSPHSAKEEDKRDDAMATNSENMDFDNETGVERPKQEGPEEPFSLGGPSNAPVSPPLPPNNFGFNRDQLADIVEEQERRMRGEQ